MSLSPTVGQGLGSPGASSPGRQPTLHIISHDTSIPTDLDLRYDARAILNPPRDVRARHTGLSSDVQEDLLLNEKYQDMVNAAEAQIREEMGKRIERAESGGGGAVGLNIGCMCVSGHHRSVAMAEELGKREWPVQWKIEVTHRDLTDEVRERKSVTRERVAQDAEAKKVVR